MTFDTFTDWQVLLNHVSAGLPLWYQAPMDPRPVRVQAYVRGDARVRVFPPTADADPFTADARHMERFRKETP